MKTNFTNLHEGVLFILADSGAIYQKNNCYSATKVGCKEPERRAWGFETVTPLYNTPVTFMDNDYLQYDKHKECTWYVNTVGTFHKLDGPAVTERLRSKTIENWYQNGLRHRDGAPAVVESTGTTEWWQRDRLHREDGPAVEIFFDGYWSNRMWYLNGLPHRLDGPSMVNSEGDYEYHVNGKRHRLDGPAIDQDQELRYFVDGIEYSEGLEYLVAVEQYKQLHRLI